jgi:hypothetical protein
VVPNGRTEKLPSCGAARPRILSTGRLTATSPRLASSAGALVELGRVVGGLAVGAAVTRCGGSWPSNQASTAARSQRLWRLISGRRFALQVEVRKRLGKALLGDQLADGVEDPRRGAVADPGAVAMYQADTPPCCSALRSSLVGASTGHPHDDVAVVMFAICGRRQVACSQYADFVTDAFC